MPFGLALSICHRITLTIVQLLQRLLVVQPLTHALFCWDYHEHTDESLVNAATVAIMPLNRYCLSRKPIPKYKGQFNNSVQCKI